MIILILLLNIIPIYSICDCSTFTTKDACTNYYTCFWNGEQCIQPTCSQILQQTKCQEPQCTWVQDQCYNSQTCNYISNSTICAQQFGCVYNDGFCLDYETCNFSSPTNCTGITPGGIQCFWNYDTNDEGYEGCFPFETCNKLHINDCESVPYCIAIKKECKDKSTLKCSDLKDETLCQQMLNYQCIWTNNHCDYFGCDTYDISSLNCYSHGCTWTGSSCQYCDLNMMNENIFKLLIIILMFLF